MEHLVAAWSSLLSRTASRLSPGDVRTWESVQPWNVTKEQAESQNPGYVFLQRQSGTETASYDPSGRIGLTPGFFDMPEGARQAIMYHEAGHALESLFDLASFQALGVDNPLDLMEWPGAQRFGYNYSEVLAEAYAVLWTEPEWLASVPGSDRIVALVRKMADATGWPLP